ncbi:hypothetical protein Plhal304r1_c041g0119511 [Plasmopara halstedii]
MSIYGRVVAMSSTNFQNTHRTVFDDVAELSKGQGSTLYISYAYCGTMKAEKHSNSILLFSAQNTILRMK